MTLPEAIEFVRPSVVQISARFDSLPDALVPLGTGFMVNAEGYVITARHVVEALQSAQVPGNKRLLVGIALPNTDNLHGINFRASFSYVPCDVVEEDVLHDIALLIMKMNPFTGGMGTLMKTPTGSVDYPHKVAVLSPDRPPDGEHIALSGYPLSGTILITTSGSVASAWDYRVERVHRPDTPVDFPPLPTTIDSYLVDMHINHGNSGGPVYSVEDGAVIGICVSFEKAPVEFSNGSTNSQMQSLSFNSGLGDVVPARYIIDVLKKHSLKWTEKKSASNQVKPVSGKP